MSGALVIIGTSLCVFGWLWATYEMFLESKLLGIIAIVAFPVAFIISLMPNTVDIPNKPFLVMAAGLLVFFMSATI